MPPLLFPPSTSPPPEKDDPYTAGAKPADGAADGDQGVPSTSKSQPNYDVVLFIGMAAPRDYYTLETLAHRDGYLFPDVDGKTMQGDEEWKKLGAPGILKTAFDTEDVWRRWKAELVVSLLGFAYCEEVVLFVSLTSKRMPQCSCSTVSSCNWRGRVGTALEKS